MSKVSATQQIANTGAKPISKAAASAAVALGQQARGEALADLAIAEAKAQGSIWNRYYRDMFDLDIDGRKAFRSRLVAHGKLMAEYVKDAGGKYVAPAHQGAKTSANTRLAELTTISKAMDGGAVFDKEWPFHYAVGFAREHQRKNGTASTRGRKATPLLEKVKAWMEKNVPADQMPTVAELVSTMAKVKAPPAALV